MARLIASSSGRASPGSRPASSETELCLHVGWERPGPGRRKCRRGQELLQHLRACVQALREELVRDLLEPLHVGVAACDREQRGLDDRQRCDEVGPPRGGDQRAEPAIGEADEVRARRQQREQVGGVVLEVLPAGGADCR